jgi:uncharacterized protein (TIGR00369 family)
MDSPSGRSMTVTWTDPAEALPSLGSLAGLEYLRLVRDGRLPPPPIAQVFGMRFGEIEDGRFSVTCDPREAFFNPLGTVHGGLACTMLDTALGCAGHSTLPAGAGYTSIDITVSYLRPILPSAGPLTAIGTVVKRGRRVVFAEAALTDGTGTTYATATSSLLVIGPQG